MTVVLVVCLVLFAAAAGYGIADARSSKRLVDEFKATDPSKQVVSAVNRTMTNMSATFGETLKAIGESLAVTLGNRAVPQLFPDQQEMYEDEPQPPVYPDVEFDPYFNPDNGQRDVEGYIRAPGGE